MWGDAGDLDKTLHDDVLLERAAGEVISEFGLEKTLARLYPGSNWPLF